MPTRLEVFEGYLSTIQSELESEEINKSKIGEVITNIKSKLADFDKDHQEVIKESVARKKSIAELNRQIEETTLSEKEVNQKLTDFEKQIEEYKTQLTTKETMLNEFNESLKQEFINKVNTYKIAENDKIKNFYKSLDKLDDLTPEDVKANLDKLKEHEALGIFESVTFVNTPPKPTDNGNETEAEILKKMFPSNN